MSFDEQFKIILTSSLFTLAGVFIGALIPFIKDIIINKGLVKIERIKLHDQRKIEAYQKMYAFINELKMVDWDDPTKKDLSFLNACSGKLHTALLDMPYYSSSIRIVLISIENIFDTVILDYSQKDKNCKMIEEELPKLVKKLKENVLIDFKNWD